MCRALIGPLGGGREKCAVYDLLTRSILSSQKRWRWLVLRADAATLEEQTIPLWHSVVSSETGEWDARAGRHAFKVQTREGKLTHFDVQFLALDRPEHRRRFATLEASGLWLDGARDIEKAVFERCLEIAGSWPQEEAAMPMILCTSLMPPADHWLALDPEVKLFRQPGGRSAEAENFKAKGGELPAGHYERLAKGRSAEWVRVNVDAEWSGQAGTPEEITARLDRQKAEREKLYSYYPDAGPLRRELYSKHTEFFAAGKRHQERAFIGGNRTGKALLNGTPVLTPNGFQVIESLKIGDTVIGGDGNPCYVTGVFPQGIRETVKLVFDDGASVVCDVDHLWKCRQGKERYNGDEWKVRTTKDLLAKGAAEGDPQKVAEIPVCSSYMTQREVFMDPYVLGLMLGDGCYTGSSPTPSISSADPEIIEYLNEHYATRHAKETSPYTYWIKGMVGTLKGMGIWGMYAYEKSIPRDYLLNSRPVRLAILQGLMDTDGYVEESGSHTEFYTTSPYLRDDVTFLVRSLGGKAKSVAKTGHWYKDGERHEGREGWRIHITMPICPFRLKRKVERWHPLIKVSGNRRIVFAERMSDGECTCISVDGPDHTFVTNDFIVTHNSFCNCYEATLHMTGYYPEWWEGRRFDRPVVTWVAGEDGKAVRESLQPLLLGPSEAYGTGLIPGDKIARTGSARGMADAVDFAEVHHVSGGRSRLLFKTYEQGRESFQAAQVDHMLFDEEPPRSIYSEGLTRTMSTEPGKPNGIVTCGFTPLKGISETVLHYLPGGRMPETEELRMAAWGW
jgi:phage terminase large subunit-like protein